MPRRLTISIKNYRGIKAQEVALPEGACGLLVKGGNGIGKSSFLNAILAALRARDIGVDAIHADEHSAEILLNLDALSIRRAITRKGSYLTVTEAGHEQRAAQHFLNALFGVGIDPLAIYAARPKERRKLVLAALACEVPAEIRQWAPDLPPSFDLTGNGLEVLERVTQYEYDLRRSANARAQEAAAEATRASSQLSALAAVPADTPDLATAEERLRGATAALLRLEAEAGAAIHANGRNEAVRRRVAELRDQAAENRDRASKTRMGDEAIAEETAALGRADAEVADLERQVADLERRLAEAKVRRAEIAARLANYERFERQAAHLDDAAARDEAEAAYLEASLVTVAGPSPDAIERARADVAACTEMRDVAQRADQIAKLRAEADRLASEAAAAQREADRLDDTVRFLQSEAPRIMAAQAGGGIPGLRLAGDDLFLDGIGFNSLSGSERIRLAVELAKRMAGPAKVLVIDGLEQIADDQLDDFLGLATAGGFLVFASRVTAGVLSIEAIMGEAGS